MKLQKLTFSTSFFLMMFAGCTENAPKTEKEEEQIVSKQIVKKEVPKKPMTVAEKKQHFKDILVPIATEIYNELENQYIKTKSDIKNNKNREVIEKLKKEYKAKTDEKLLEALKPHPISILLAQAAAESAWLTSRFTKEANNIFGVWSFNKNEPRIAASGLRGDKTIYLKKYSTIKDAVRDYYKNLGKNWAYAEFRKQRTLTNDPYVLSDYLTSYSEKKEVYTELLKSMISYNKFYKLDINYDPNNEFKPKPKVKKEIKPKIENTIEVQPKTKIDIKVEEKIEEKPEIKTEQKTEVTTIIKNETKQIVKSEIKPEDESKEN